MLPWRAVLEAAADSPMLLRTLSILLLPLSVLPPAVQARDLRAARASLDLPPSELLCCSPHTGMGRSALQTQREDPSR